MSANIGPKYGIIATGLVTWLDASVQRSYPGTGTIWYDLTNNSNGNLIDNAYYDANFGATGLVPGIICNAGMVSVPHVAAHLCQVSTISIWQCALSGHGGDNVWVVKGNSNTPFTHYWYGGDGRVFYGNSYAPRAFFSIPGIGVWTNYVVTYDGVGVSSYYNGNLIAYSEYTSTLTTTLPLAINGDDGGGPRYYATPKKFNQVLMYNRPLSAFEVLINYNNMKGRFGL